MFYFNCNTRDKNGEVIQIWAKPQDLWTPLQAETAAILWALQIALEKNWVRIIVQRDAKICFDSLASMSSNGNQVGWSISSLIRDNLEISKSFLSRNFYWISNVCNVVVRDTVKLAGSLRKPFSCNKFNLSPLIADICRDYCTPFVS